jgi:hypothetical protein
MTDKRLDTALYIATSTFTPNITFYITLHSIPWNQS